LGAQLPFLISRKDRVGAEDNVPVSGDTKPMSDLIYLVVGSAVLGLFGLYALALRRV